MQALIGRNVLKEEDLSEIDERLLDFLVEGRITPGYARRRIVDEGIRDNITGQYCQQKLKRLVEHDHVRKLYDQPLYELKDDPRKQE